MLFHQPAKHLLLLEVILHRAMQSRSNLASRPDIAGMQKLRALVSLPRI